MRSSYNENIEFSILMAKRQFKVHGISRFPIIYGEWNWNIL